jgi:pSer/pThr/pTyr-binding forkhead associated (FHA) protein
MKRFYDEKRSLEYVIPDLSCVSIGRNRENCIVVPPVDSSFRVPEVARKEGFLNVSGYHADLLRGEDGSLFLCDNNSTTGTFVNDSRLPSNPAKHEQNWDWRSSSFEGKVLKDGDLVRLGCGDVVLRYDER